jgi:hypothetical protein
MITDNTSETLHVHDDHNQQTHPNMDGYCNNTCLYQERRAQDHREHTGPSYSGDDEAGDSAGVEAHNDDERVADDNHDLACDGVVQKQAQP